MKIFTKISYFILISSVIFVQTTGTGSPTANIYTTVKTREHETIFLPCYAGNLGSKNVQWWHKNKLVTDAGKNLATEYFKLHLNNTLEVLDITDPLSGVYVCQVTRPASMAPITHNYVIQVLYPPKVWMTPSQNEVEVEIHQDITLYCNATGFPKPFITWTFKGNEIAGMNEQNYLILIATKDSSGEYACIASNGVGNSDMKSIIVSAVYPPSVSADKIWIHTSPGLRTVIECIVDGSPPPKVEWLMNNKPLTKDSRISYFKKGTTHGMVIKASRISDIGVYTCIASNKLGRKKLPIEVSALANVAQFKTIQDKFEDRVTLVWEVESYSPIIQYRLSFRQRINENPNFWTNLTIPAEDSIGAPIHTQWYTLTGLDNASSYEAYIISKNIFGWSKPSNIYRFSTPGLIETADEAVATEEGTESNTITGFLSDYSVTDYENEISEPSISSSGSRLIISPFFITILMTIARLKFE